MHTKIELTWPATDAFHPPAGYRVGYDTPSGSALVATIPNTVQSLIVVIRLESRTLYRFWVSAFNKAGSESERIYIQNVIQQ